MSSQNNNTLTTEQEKLMSFFIDWRFITIIVLLFLMFLTTIFSTIQLSETLFAEYPEIANIAGFKSGYWAGVIVSFVITLAFIISILLLYISSLKKNTGLLTTSITAIWIQIILYILMILFATYIVITAVFNVENNSEIGFVFNILIVLVILGIAYTFMKYLYYSFKFTRSCHKFITVNEDEEVTAPDIKRVKDFFTLLFVFALAQTGLLIYSNLNATSLTMISNVLAYITSLYCIYLALRFDKVVA